jgi:hypothetical protein
MRQKHVPLGGMLSEVTGETSAGSEYFLPEIRVGQESSVASVEFKEVIRV